MGLYRDSNAGPAALSNQFPLLVLGPQLVGNGWKPYNHTNRNN